MTTDYSIARLAHGGCADFLAAAFKNARRARQ